MSMARNVVLVHGGWLDGSGSHWGYEGVTSDGGHG
jgi:hypothetical protein